MVNIEISKKNLCLGVIGFIVLFGLGFAIAAWDTSKTMWHSGDDVRIDINSQDKSLQEAITDGDIAGGSGDITAVNAGIGLSGGGTSGSVTLNADLNSLQKRVLSSCPTGSSIRVISSTGTVTCEVDDVGGGVGGSGSTGRIAYWSGSSTLSSDSGLIWNSGSNRLGIGVSPSYPLHVSGTAHIDKIITSGVTDQGLSINANGAYFDGNVGIGAYNSGYELYVVGDAWISGRLGDGTNSYNLAWTTVSICAYPGVNGYNMMNLGSGCPDGWTNTGSVHVLMGT